MLKVDINKKEIDKENEKLFNEIILGKYKIIKEIGKGSFGTVYKGIDSLANINVAIKTEDIKTKDNTSLNLLKKESIRLQQLQPHKSIPKFYAYGQTKEKNILVMELLGKSLGKIFELNGKKLPLKAVCYLGIEMIDIIKYIHSKGIIHRDIKPDNFIMGKKENKNNLYIIDFGLSKHYLTSYFDNKKNEFVFKHISHKTGKYLTGTARYCSIYTHQGIEQSRRDDIESIGYLLIYLLKGKLPWMGIKRKNKNDQNYEKIGQIKLETSVESLTNGCPSDLAEYFYASKRLGFEEEPNYELFKNIFKNILNKIFNGYSPNYKYNWNKKISQANNRLTSEKNNNKMQTHKNKNKILVKDQNKSESEKKLQTEKLDNKANLKFKNNNDKAEKNCKDIHNDRKKMLDDSSSHQSKRAIIGSIDSKCGNDNNNNDYKNNYHNGKNMDDANKEINKAKDKNKNEDNVEENSRNNSQEIYENESLNEKSNEIMKKNLANAQLDKKIAQDKKTKKLHPFLPASTISNSKTTKTTKEDTRKNSKSKSKKNYSPNRNHCKDIKYCAADNYSENEFKIKDKYSTSSNNNGDHNSENSYNINHNKIRSRNKNKNNEEYYSKTINVSNPKEKIHCGCLIF